MPTRFDTDAALQDILFHELHHRFYNSLQFVSSAVGVLSKEHRCPRDMADLQDRIVALGSLHRALASPVADLAELRSVIRRLCSGLTGGVDHSPVTLDLDRLEFPKSAMVVRGVVLILVELVTNAIKHGKDGEGPITVSASSAAQHVVLTVTNRTTSPSTGEGTRRPLTATRLAEAMGGTLALTSDANQVVSVTVHIPGQAGPARGDQRCLQ